MSIVDKGIAEIVLQPVRFRIIKCLQESKEPLYIEQIAERVDESSRLVSHHLDVLEDLGLVTSEFKITSPQHNKPAAARFFSVTPRLTVVLEEITSVLDNIQNSL